MKKTNLTFVITTSAPGAKRKGGIYVVCGYKGQSSGRRSFLIKLESPNLKSWSKKERRFIGRLSVADVNNNTELDKIESFCKELLNNSRVTTPIEFIDALKIGVAPKETITLGEFINDLINTMKNIKTNDKPSRNYQLYRNLLHKLEAEGNIIDKPINDIDDLCFRKFASYILSLPPKKGRNNFDRLCMLFKAVWRKAFEAGLNSNVLTYRYKKDVPIIEREKLHALTPEQYHQFVTLDLSAIPQSGVNPSFYKELYRDFCIWLYEVSARPADVIRAHSSQIVSINGKMCYRYIPEKKKNPKDRKVSYVIAPLSDIALSIIEKYKGQSSKGYIFPFAMNERGWDFDDPTSWNMWNNRKNRAEEMIRAFLRKIQIHLGLSFPLTLYTFRRSIITHKVGSGKDIAFIAHCAGTSINMIDGHYYDHTTQFNAI